MVARVIHPWTMRWQGCPGMQPVTIVEGGGTMTAISPTSIKGPAGPPRSRKATVTEPIERLVKSADRVRDLGEVFTPARTVTDMLATLPDDTWAVHPAQTFLEPACGDGNFLVAILDRKLQSVASHAAKEVGLPAGSDALAFAFHILEALSSVYGVDISDENINGGRLDHPLGARDRLLVHISAALAATGMDGVELSKANAVARWIVDVNVQVGNMHAPSGTRSPVRDSIRVHQFNWSPETLEVCVEVTTMGAILEEAEQESTGVVSLFGAPEATPVWSGYFLDLGSAQVPKQTKATRKGKP